MEYLCESCWNYPCASDKTKKITDCFAYRPKPSNGDRLRAMTDEELAELVTDDMCELLCGAPLVCEGQCKQKMLDWLRQEAEA